MKPKPQCDGVVVPPPRYQSRALCANERETVTCSETEYSTA